MAGTGTKNAQGGTSPRTKPRSGQISAGGIHTGEDFAGLMSALMSDVIEGRISPAITNAACNAGGKLLKVVEMQYRYGTQSPTQKRPAFELAPRNALRGRS